MDKKLHKLPDLPYAYDALEPYIDEETMKLHHDKHHTAYVNNLNSALERYDYLFEKSVEQLLMSLNDARALNSSSARPSTQRLSALVPEEIRTAVRNNAGGHVNHSMFWQIMMPVGTRINADQNGGSSGLAKGEAASSDLRGKKEPSGTLLQDINKYFGSFSEFQNKFNDTGLKRFGSGWVWLVRSRNGKLDVISTPNQDNPMTEGYFPIMGNDVWEHAYYLKYKNMRADYLKAWWNVINWQEVEKRLNIKN